MQNWQCRWSPTLGALERTHQEVWGTKDYENDTDPTVFFGLYGLPDFYALWRHKGEKHILWAGTDIIHFENGYWLDKEGQIRIDNKSFAKWINSNCENWCENDVERERLARCGILAKVYPSFLGNIDDFEVSFKPGNKVYSSVSGDNFKQYGWFTILDLAVYNPGVEFHLYGNTKSWLGTQNIIVHGRVPKEQMNAEIKQMQGGLRMTEFDGFSEILAKSILWGQWPISLIDYPHIMKPNQLSEILNKKEPNLEGREYYRRILNDYPWSTKKNS